jgi:PAS domain S-box-containing protein
MKSRFEPRSEWESGHRAGEPNDRRKTDEWFRVLVEAMDEGLGILDEAECLRYVNPAFCRMTGYSQAELLGRKITETELFQGENKADLFRHLEGHRRGDYDPYELEWCRKDGSTMIGHISPRPLFAGDGSLRGSFAIITDITERRQREELITRLSAAVEQSPVGIMITDRHGRIEYANRGFEELTGYACGELIGKNPSVLQSGQTPQEIYENLWKSVIAGNEWRGELCDRKKSGETYWAKVTIFSVKDARGRIRYLVSLNEDITARKLAEQRLLESEEKYSVLVENSLTGIYILQDGRIAFSNREHASRLGYDVDELVGKDFSALIHPEDRAQYVELIGQALLGCHDAETGVVLRAVAQSGAIISFKNSCLPIIYRGRPAILGNAVDITEEKRLQAELSLSAVQLQALSEQLLASLEKERQRVASDLHDSVGQYLHAIKFGLQKAPQANCFKREERDGHVPACANLMSLLQEAIDEVRRISADLRPPILDDLGLLAALNWFCRRYGNVYSAIEITKAFEISEIDIPDPIKIDVFRVVQEALGNAAKYSGATRVELGLSKKNGHLVLTIRDNGAGFAVDSVLQSEPGGGGFGLIGMRERVKLSGGSLSIESARGQGTRIEALWPIKAMQDVPASS